MKKVKISLIAMAILLSCGILNAQISLQAGFSSTKSTQSNTEALNGFNVGTNYDYFLTDQFGIESGLLFNYFTKKTTFLSANANLTRLALDIPIRALFSYEIKNGLKIYAFAGPNFNLGLLEKYKEQSVEFDMYKNLNDYSRFDVQLGGGVGIKYGKLGLKAGYDFGMLNRYKNANPAWKFNDLKIGLTYDL